MWKGFVIESKQYMDYPNKAHRFWLRFPQA